MAANNPTERNKKIKREESKTANRMKLNVHIMPQNNNNGSSGSYTPQFSGFKDNNSGAISEFSDRESPFSIDSLKSLLDEHEFDGCFPTGLQLQTDGKRPRCTNIPLFVTNSKNQSHSSHTGKLESNNDKKDYNCRVIRQEYNDLVVFGPLSSKVECAGNRCYRSGRPFKYE